MNYLHRYWIKAKTFYELAWVDKFEDPNTLAECRFYSQQIAIKKGQSEVATLKSFIHEIIHALDVEHKLGLTHAQVYKLERITYQFLKFNGFLRKK